MRRIIFSIAFFRKKLSVQSTPTSTKSRWKFSTQVGHRSFHTAWVKTGRACTQLGSLLCPQQRTSSVQTCQARKVPIDDIQSDKAFAPLQRRSHGTFFTIATV